MEMDTKSDLQNFHFKGNNAFTEDNVLIYNIFVYNIPREFTENEVSVFFSQWGPVNKVQFINDKKCGLRPPPKLGFVHFKESTSAAAVLKRSKNAFGSRRMYVRACDTWLQPGVHEIQFFHKKNTSNNSAKNSIRLKDEAAEGIHGDDDGLSINVINSKAQPLNILNLNDDCLEHICKMLQLRSQVLFGRVCRRFLSVFDLCTKNEVKLLVLERLDSMTLYEIRDLFTVAGRYMEKVIGLLPFKYGERIMEFISTFCTNLKSISISSSPMRASTLGKLAHKLHSITELELEDCDITDNCVGAISKFRNLELLSLSLNVDLRGKHLSKLTKLKKLNLSNCGYLSAKYIAEISEAMKSLEALNVEGCESLSTPAYEAISKNLKSLESIDITIYEDINYECIASLPNLKRLKLHHSPYFYADIRYELFVNLAEKKADQLEYLKITVKNAIFLERAKLIGKLTKLKYLICPNNDQLNDECLEQFSELEDLEELVIKICKNVTDDGLLRLLQRCRKLKRIHAEGTNISDKFVFSAINILKERGPQDHTLTIYAAVTNIQREILNNPKYMAGSDYVKVSFHIQLSMDLEYLDELHDVYNDFDSDDDDFNDSDMYDFEDEADSDFSLDDEVIYRP